MVIVGGWFEVDPGARDAFVASRVEGMRRSRSEPGCLEYVVAPDPADPGRVVLFERWESQAHLDAHLAAARARQAAPSEGSSAEPSVSPKSATIRVYDVTGERGLR